MKAARERLGTSVAYEVHAHPGRVFFGATDDDMRTEIRQRLGDAAGAAIDLNLSDIHSVGDDPATLTRWTRIAQEEAAR